MRRSKYTDEQVAYAVRLAEAGRAPAEVCRKLGISEPTYYRRRREYGGLQIEQIRRTSLWTPTSYGMPSSVTFRHFWTR